MSLNALMVQKTFMEYTAVINKTPDGWYTAQYEQLPEALTQGKTINETIENLKDAVALCLEYKKEEIEIKFGESTVIR